ncbi:hypothetical protein TNCV_2925301 [Trichonephila clavipes]|nr:hypothetical protein TNCV_2925301 [Trichonephila clavipes]
MDDNATIYRARSVQNWLVEHQSDFQHLPWSPPSPNLNLIENVWDTGKTHIRQHSSLPTNLQDLKSCIANAWYSSEALHKHVYLTSKPIRAVIRAKGGPIKY